MFIQDKFQNFERDWDETESLGTLSHKTETLVLHWFTNLDFSTYLDNYNARGYLHSVRTV